MVLSIVADLARPVKLLKARQEARGRLPVGASFPVAFIVSRIN
jgi:hypothetical protein